MPSRLPRTDEAGFTILECVIASMVLVLMAYGWMRLHSSHAELIASLDQDYELDPIYSIDRAEQPMDRLVGISATLVEGPPTGPNIGAMPNPYDVTVLLLERSLDPPTASARAFMVEN